jgi:long-subunit acyl-CoA synthetase (AMP-forming)
MTEFTNTESPLDMFYHWESKKPDAVYLRQPVDQVWNDYSWQEVGAQARRIAAALQDLGINAGERVSILSKNCAHWVIADLATMMSGGSTAPVFTTMTAKDVRYILDHSGAKILFVGETQNWDLVRKELPDDIKVIALPFADVPGADYSWDTLLAEYEALDMPLCELYGQSEVLSGTSNLPWDRKSGTLGKPTCNTYLKIADNGEILIKAKAVMTGYLNEPEKTADTLIDGWVHTGDKGEIDEDGFLKITGRIKEIFKGTKGKYVAPLPIESSFSTNRYLEQMCLMGNGLAQTVLLVQLSAQGKEMDIEKLESELRRQTLEVNADLDSHAKIASVIISAQDWSAENGLVTHTMKINRSALEKHYSSLAEMAFSNGASIKAPLVIFEGAEPNGQS